MSFKLLKLDSNLFQEVELNQLPAHTSKLDGVVQVLSTMAYTMNTVKAVKENTNHQIRDFFISDFIKKLKLRNIKNSCTHSIFFWISNLKKIIAK